MHVATIAVLLVLLLVCLVIAALCLVGTGGAQGISRGGNQPRTRVTDPAKSPHVVVDTLNLAHWLRKDREGALSTKDIIGAISATAPSLKIKHPGRVMYVLKDRETQFNTDASRELLRKAAEDNGVYVFLAEKYPDPPPSARRSEKRAEHSSRARDDFLMAVLASRWRCAVLTDDRLRDFDRFRDAVLPFHVYEFAYWRKLPVRDFIRPESGVFVRLRKPKRVRYEDYFARGG